MKRYGNPYWQEATDNRDKTVAVMREDTFQQIQQALDKSGLNYCAYSDGSNTMIAVNSSEIDHFKNVTGLDESLCRLQKSGKEHIPQDKNVIGNTDYKYIPQKSLYQRGQRNHSQNGGIGKQSEHLVFSKNLSQRQRGNDCISG